MVAVSVVQVEIAISVAEVEIAVSVAEVEIAVSVAEVEIAVSVAEVYEAGPGTNGTPLFSLSARQKGNFSHFLLQIWFKNPPRRTGKS